jgi:hypothetical protein
MRSGTHPTLLHLALCVLLLDISPNSLHSVRRSEIYNPSSSPSSPPTSSRSTSPAQSTVDPDTEARLLARLAEIYGPITKPAANNASPALRSSNTQPSDQQRGQQEIEFRLFSTPNAPSPDSSGAQSHVPKIILDHEWSDSEAEKGAFVRKKPRSYYFSAVFPKEQRGIAISGEEVLHRSQQRHWGIEVGWRVTVLQCSSKSSYVSKAVEDKLGFEERVRMKKKLNKKGRIKLRKKLQDIRVKEEQSKKEREMKEETEKEKKVRRNREKKLKRRAKEKAEKEAKRGAGTNVDVVVEMGEDGSGSGSGSE